MEAHFYAMHHLAALFAVTIIVTESTLIPAGLMFIRASAIPFQDTPSCLVTALIRCNLVADAKWWRTFQFYQYTLVNLIVIALEWHYLIFLSGENNMWVYLCIASWQLTEIYGMYCIYGWIQTVPQIMKKKMAREIEFLTKLEQSKEGQCGGKSLEC